MTIAKIEMLNNFVYMIVPNKNCSDIKKNVSIKLMWFNKKNS